MRKELRESNNKEGNYFMEERCCLRGNKYIEY